MWGRCRFSSSMDMDKTQRDQFRADFFEALVKVTEGGGCGLPRDVEIEKLRKVAFESGDKFIEEMADGRTPEEAAELYTY